MSQEFSKIQLSEEAKARLLYEIKGFYQSEFDEDISDYKVERLFDFLIKKIGSPIYNQAIQDARAYMMTKLDDLEGDLYEHIQR